MATSFVLPTYQCNVAFHRRSEECFQSDECFSPLMSATKYPSKQCGLNFDDNEQEEEEENCCNETNTTLLTEADLTLAAKIASVDQALFVDSTTDYFSGNLRGTWAFGTFLALLFVVGVNKVFHFTSAEHSSYSLAPAAIQSVTDVLGPILPFTGGVDLRREDVNIWQLMLPDSVAESWEVRWHSFGAAKTTITSTTHHPHASLIPGIGRGGAQTVQSLSSRTTRWTKEPKRGAVIGAPDSFVSLTKISQMTLDDLTNVFQYAIHVNRPGFNKADFLAGLSSNMVSIISSMDEVTAQSRGKDVMIAQTRESPQDENESGSSLSSHGYGDIDALYFCAAMRIFAEWRMQRQVPEGYKGYEVGMSLGRKDCVQNLVKAEYAVHHWIEERIEYLRMKRQHPNELIEDDMDDTTLRSPSLRELLVEEIHLNLHKRPRLKEKSAAMGLLWVRRQFHYQVAIFDNFNSGKHSTSQDAVMEAYKEVYSNYHGWAVQKIFNYSFQAAPAVETILKLMHRDYYEIILEQSKTVIVSTEQLEISMDEVSIPDMDKNCSFDSAAGIENSLNRETDQVEPNPFLHFWKAATTECSKIGNHIGNEWQKLASNTLRFLRIAKDQDKMHVGSSNVGLEGEALEQFINEKLLEHNQKAIDSHFAIAKPLLRDLAGLFDELNMNDPTKV